MSARAAGLAPGRERSPLEEELKARRGKPVLPLTGLAVEGNARPSCTGVKCRIMWQFDKLQYTNLLAILKKKCRGNFIMDYFAFLKTFCN